jgi:hypothetical protein
LGNLHRAVGYLEGIHEEAHVTIRRSWNRQDLSHLQKAIVISTSREVQPPANLVLQGIMLLG